MLAIFDKTVAKCPEGLRSPHSSSVPSEKSGSLVENFCSVKTGAVNMNLGGSGLMAYTNEGQNLLLPRYFAVVDDIFCLFQGSIENIGPLKQQYGLSKTANEVIIVIEAYRVLRDRGPYPADQVVRDLNGKFAFVLYDSTSMSVFIATDADGSVPFFWGTDSEERLVLSDDVSIVKRGCGNSFAPFPKGCFFTSRGGIQSFEHPLNEMKPMPRIDSQGQVCGANYTVDATSKKDSGIPRVGSDANWAFNP